MTLAFFGFTLAWLLIVSGMRGQTVPEVLRGAVARREPQSPAEDVGLYAGLEPTRPAGSGGAGGVTVPVAAGQASSAGGARGIVDQAAAATGLPVISAYRPGDPLDHGSNDADRAARDLSNTGNSGWSPEMDRGVQTIGQMFGQSFPASGPIVKTWNWNGFRLQLIARTPLYGDHRGHIHFGARRLGIA